LFKGHAEHEVDAQKEEGGGFIVVNYLPWICLASESVCGSLPGALCVSLFSLSLLHICPSREPYCRVQEGLCCDMIYHCIVYGKILRLLIKLSS
jgi:hypothetical protein